MISGIVIDTASGDPVRKAIVTVTWQGTPRSWATTRTDGSGRFTFEGLPPGKYDLRATKAGLGSATYGADSIRELGDLITLSDGETRGNIKLRFLRAASISGRVVDPDGDPVPGANIMVLRAGRNLGERVLQNYRASSTNDRGEYDISMLDPGEYYLRCMPMNNQIAPLPSRNGASVTQAIVVPQYYGGARSAKDAAGISIRSGEVLTGFDFHLTAEHPAQISGRIMGVPQPDPPVESAVSTIDGPFAGRVLINGRIRGGGPQVTLDFSPADDGMMQWNSGRSVAGPDYQFELPEAVPGRYRLQATFRTKDKTYHAYEVIDAHEGVNEIALTMVPAVDVKGHLKIEGPGDHPTNLTVALASSGFGPRPDLFSGHVGKDGSFVIKDVPPGEWVVNINPMPLSIFEKSVILGDRNFLFKKLEIPAGLDAPLNIVLSSSTATIQGDIDSGGADSKRAGILLAPFGERHDLARFYYSAVSDDKGQFKLTGVAPGKYKIFALEKIATANFRAPEFTDVLDALGQELEVSEGAKVQSHPKLIPEDKAKELLKP